MTHDLAERLPRGLRLLRVPGDAMRPTFHALDRIVVDTSDTEASAPGIFILSAAGGFDMRRLEPVPHSNPAMVRITCDNPAYPPREVPAERLQIEGRVVGHVRSIG